MNIKKYTTALNFRTLISVIISLAATWIAYKYNLAFNLDLTLRYYSTRRELLISSLYIDLENKIYPW